MNTAAQTPEFKDRQILRVLPIDSTYTINRVTEKAVLLECSDGRWGGNGFKGLWVPKSIMNYQGFNDSRDNSQYGIHTVVLPDWYINQNAKTL